MNFALFWKKWKIPIALFFTIILLVLGTLLYYGIHSLTKKPMEEEKVESPNKIDMFANEEGLPVGEITLCGNEFKCTSTDQNMMSKVPNYQVTTEENKFSRENNAGISVQEDNCDKNKTSIDVNKINCSNQNQNVVYDAHDGQHVVYDAHDGQHVVYDIYNGKNVVLDADNDKNVVLDTDNGKDVASETGIINTENFADKKITTLDYEIENNQSGFTNTTKERISMPTIPNSSSDSRNVPNAEACNANQDDQVSSATDIAPEEVDINVPHRFIRILPPFFSLEKIFRLINPNFI